MISVIILNYNTFEMTAASIESVLEHSKDVDHEVILVDNGSTERNPREFETRFPGIRLVLNEQNLGFAKGINSALSVARGEYLLFLNSDTVVTSGVLGRCKEYMDENPHVGALTTRLLSLDGRPQAVINRFPFLRREFHELFRLHKFLSDPDLLLGEFFAYDRPILGDWIWGAFFFTRREVVDSLPGRKMPDEFFMYFEDVQWGFALQKLRYKVAFAPLGDVIHRCTGSSDLNDVQKLSLITANERSFIEGWRGKGYLRLLYALRAFKFLSIRQFRTSAFFFRQCLTS